MVTGRISPLVWRPMCSGRKGVLSVPSQPETLSGDQLLVVDGHHQARGQGPPVHAGSRPAHPARGLRGRRRPPTISLLRACPTSTAFAAFPSLSGMSSSFSARYLAVAAFCKRDENTSSPFSTT